MKKKIIHLIGHLKMGGAETLVTDYALNINKDKFEVVIVTTSERNNTINEEKLKQSGIRVHFIGESISFPGTSNQFKRAVNKIQRHILFLKIVKDEKPDIIHTHLSTNEYMLLVNTRKKKIKTYHTVHSEVGAMFSKKNQKKITQYCIKKKGMNLIALHSRMKEEINALFGIESCIVIRNAIDIKRFKEVNSNKEKMLQSLNIDENSFVIGHVGRFTKTKNHSFLIKTFKKVKETRANAHLMLIGKGELEPEIKGIINKEGLSKSVSFLGNRSDIPELMNAMDVFVFPSLYEGFGNVLIEAQATGLICVVSDSIPKEAFITNLVKPLSLNESLEEWNETISYTDKPNEIKGDLERFDIAKIIIELENKYLEN